MKLSKRIKQFRRGRHTKRSGKHTRRKYRGKQYKRTYRKNNRKLKNNKRIQRGGAPITTSPEVKWDKTNTTNYLLRYTKKGSIFYESKPFDITFEFIQSNNSIGLSYKLPDGRYPILSKYFYGTFKVTMTRKTSDGKVFVVYFAVYGIERKVTYDDGTTKPSIHPVVVYSSDKNFEDIPHKMIDKLDSPCYGLSGVTADISKESYDFPCGNNGGYQECDGNRKFFFSLIKKMFEMGKKEYDDAKKAKADEANANAPAPNAVTSTPPAPTHADDPNASDPNAVTSTPPAPANTNDDANAPAVPAPALTHDDADANPNPNVDTNAHVDPLL